MRIPPGTELDEAALIAAARLGDEDAFTELYHRHIGYVKAVGRAVLRKNDLDDMCQDTFLLAFSRLHSFEGTSQFRTWVTRIAINRCLVTLRKARQTSNGESNLIQMDAEVAGEDILDRWVFASRDTHLEGVPARLDLIRLLRVLKPIERLVLEMAYLEDVPDLEIAEMLGLTLASVKSKIHHAKRRIRALHKNR
jgi:RNA polymerase sigma-70 factor (ECF subfamily)